MKTPTMLSIKPKLPVGDRVLKKIDPLNVISPLGAVFPISCESHVTVSPFSAVITPCPSPYSMPLAQGVVVYVPI